MIDEDIFTETKTSLLKEDFKSSCNHLRQHLKQLGDLTLNMKRHAAITQYGASPKSRKDSDPGEMTANIVLAYRHIEDAAMRLGKSIQAFDCSAAGGISCYGTNAGHVSVDGSEKRNVQEIPKQNKSIWRQSYESEREWAERVAHEFGYVFQMNNDSTSIFNYDFIHAVRCKESFRNMDDLVPWVDKMLKEREAHAKLTKNEPWLGQVLDDARKSVEKSPVDEASALVTTGLIERAEKLGLLIGIRPMVGLGDCVVFSLKAAKGGLDVEEVACFSDKPMPCFERLVTYIVELEKKQPAKVLSPFDRIKSLITPEIAKRFEAMGYTLGVADWPGCVGCVDVRLICKADRSRNRSIIGTPEETFSFLMTELECMERRALLETAPKPFVQPPPAFPNSAVVTDVPSAVQAAAKAAQEVVRHYSNKPFTDESHAA